MTTTPAMTIYEKTFAKTEKTDAVLVVGDKKMHVNKAILSYHSDYFNTLFNSDFKEKSMEEIPIDDVIYEDFAALLSLIQEKPIKFTEEKAEKLLELADRFLLPSVKRHVELFLMTSSKDRMEKIRIADAYRLDKLLKHAGLLYAAKSCFQKSVVVEGAWKRFKKDEFENVSEETSARLFERVLDLMFGTEDPGEDAPSMLVYEEAFVKTDRTDAILVVDGKKMHVNRALLSYHSDFFDKLFNSDFKEKSMEEIPIDDVIFEDFAALLSLIQYNPIMPTESNAEKLLELADRFLLPSIKRHVELFLMTSSKDRMEAIRIADKYRLEDLVDRNAIKFCTNDDFQILRESKLIDNFSARTKSKLFTKLLSF